MDDFMKKVLRIDQAIFFLCGFLLLVTGMALEFLLAAILPAHILGSFFEHGGLLILLTLFFSSGVYLLRRSILGRWRYGYDYIIFIIAGTIFLAGSVMTMFRLQVGHPYLELATTNPLLMMVLWVFILPPINPAITAGFSVLLFSIAGLHLAFPPLAPISLDVDSKLSDHSKVSWWRILVRMIRVDVWLGSLFLVILAFLILGGSPLSSSPLPLYDVWMWSRLLIALLAAALFNSCVFIVNQLGDIDTDRLHPEKAQLPLSADQLNRNQVGIIILVFLVVGALMAIIVGIPYLMMLSIIIIFALIYSLPPFRLKARLGLDLFMIGLAFGVWAILAAWMILFSLPELPLVLLIGPGVFYAGTHGIHTASDYTADAEAGVKTTAVVLGPKLTARIGIILIGIGLFLLYAVTGFYTHIFWYGLMKYKSILLIIFSGLPVFALLNRFRRWQKTQNNESIQGIQVQARGVTYLLFLTLLVYLMLYVFLFYPVYYPNYNFPWG
jgi:4-hydroxybenzoate polyprenyltransferase